MKAANQLTESDKMLSSPGIPIDPFAVDFFGGKISPPEEIESQENLESKKQTKPRKKSDWYRNLPRLTNTEAEFSTLLQSLPERFTEESAKIIGASIARFTFRQPENVVCSVISVTETNLSEAIHQISKSPQIFLTLGSQPENSPAMIALNTDFASTVIDLVLGGKGADFQNQRNLSPIEQTIIEFLAVNILGEINDFLGEPLFCLQNVKNESNISFESFERGAEIVASLEVDGFDGIISLFATQQFLNNLVNSQNPFLQKKPNKKKLSNFERILQKLDLRLQVGTTFLDADSLLFLETDDIILIEQPQINLGNGNFGENLQVCVGSGRGFRLQGTAESYDFTDDLSFRIGEISSEETRRKFTPAKFKMDEKEIELSEETDIEPDEQLSEEANEEGADEQISPSLENIQVALRVEIAGNKLSLRELQNLRAGQIIALGCRPTDPVRLIADNNEEPVATGELIEIEGQLGVRLTKVFI
jgi:flagellar motor switch protein FliM